MPDLYFAIPGDLHTLTGGYGYDRRLLAELTLQGLAVEHVPLSATFPLPAAAALSDAEAKLAVLPTGAVVLIDGLAFGAMDDIASKHGTRLRLIALCHHPLALEAGLTDIRVKQFQQSEQRALAHTVAVVVTSTATATLLQRDFSVPKQKIVVAQPGTDPQTFAACKGAPPILLTVATLTRRKAHDVLLAALATLTHLPWQARWVGGGEFDPAWSAMLQRQIAAHGLQDRIHCVGSMIDVRAEYSQADLFVSPSLYEGYGMACAEALAFGLPIVATKVGAAGDLVSPASGLLVAPGNSNEIATALDALLNVDGAASRARLQQGARAAARALPTWSATAKIVATMIREVRSR
jgi:glycosyltransferase involved in cell wall biosynthesis